MLRDPDGKISFWSRGAERLYGFSSNEAVGQISYELLRTEFPCSRAEIEEKLRKHDNWQGELIHYHRDGTPITVASHWAVHRRTHGKADAIIEIFNDITERKRDEIRLRLLVHELNHRVKNTLATVQAIAARSLRKADPEQRKTLDARLLALASVHDVLTEAYWEGADLDEVVARVLAPHGGRDSVRFDVSGPPARLPPRAALALAMALHELATNALLRRQSNTRLLYALTHNRIRKPDG
jgi:PAS domain S-box-containing protein